MMSKHKSILKSYLNSTKKRIVQIGNATESMKIQKTKMVKKWLKPKSPTYTKNSLKHCALRS